MEWNQMQGEWDKFKGAVKEKWGKFTDSDLTKIAGKKDELVGMVKHVYGVAKEDAEKQVEEFRRNHSSTTTDDTTEGKH